MSEVSERKVKSEIKNTAGTSWTPLRQICDSGSNFQPFVTQTDNG